MCTFRCSILALVLGTTGSCVSQLDGLPSEHGDGAAPSSSGTGSSEHTNANDLSGQCAAGSVYVGDPAMSVGLATAKPYGGRLDATVEPSTDADDAEPGDAALGHVGVDAATTPPLIEEPYCLPCTPGQYCPGGATEAQPCSDGSWDDDADPATACVTHSECAAGSYASVQATPVTDTVCTACAPGTFSTTANATTCKSWQECEPGAYISVAGSPTRDAVCEGCLSGTFSDRANAQKCSAWTDCQDSQYVLMPGSATGDRTCADCPQGESSSGVNVGSCTATGTCPAGTAQMAAATESTPSGCEPCARGTYCSGGETEPVACAAGTFDEDGDPATPCVSKSVCIAGQALVSEGNTISDRTCLACVDGTYSTETNAVSCQAWRVCEAGTYVGTEGSANNDRVCTACPANRFSTSRNAEQCSPHTICAAPLSYEAEAPSATSDRACDLCISPERTTEDNASSCSLPVFQMVDDQVVIEAENYHSQASNGSPILWTELAAADASADASMQLGPDEGGVFWTENPITTAPRLDYNVSFTTTGTFYLFLRGAGANTNGNSDSCYAGIGNAHSEYRFDIVHDQWDWVGSPFTVVETGVHTVSVWGREDGFRADKIVLRTSPTAPIGEGPAQSPEQ